MASRSPNTILRHLRRLLQAPRVEALTDGQLLEQFVVHQEEQAFEALLQRHGPMVLGLCRRVLQNTSDADDAMQATFLVLVSKASSIAKRESVGSWLYGVAYRIALRAKARNARRRVHETPMAKIPDIPHDESPDQQSGHELWPALDEEVERLPEKYRAPMVLCYLQGYTNVEAARQLCWSPGTLQGRLARARQLLRTRLARRGLLLWGGAVASAAAPPAALATLPPALIAATIRTAALIAAGQAAAAGVISTQVATLMQGALKAMIVTKLKIATVVLLTVGAVTLGVNALALQVLPQQADQAVATAVPVPVPTPTGQTIRPAQPVAPQQDGQEQVTITGQVLDPAGKPVAGAQVRVLAYPKAKPDEEPSGKLSSVQLGKADEKGQFHLSVPLAGPNRLVPLYVVATAPGFGFRWQQLSAEANQTAMLIRLHPERVLRGRVLDLQGQSVAGAKVQIGRAVFSREGEFFGSSRGSNWPEPITTDAEGRFVLRGIGRDVQIELDIQNDRFARRWVEIKPQSATPDQELAIILTAEAQSLTGRVICGDTGQPVPNARLHITVYAERFGIGSSNSAQQMRARAGGTGRFQLKPYAGKFFLIEAFAPTGQPYLGLRKSFDWPKGTVRQEVELALPRGVLVRGKVTEAPSGKPVAGATVDFFPERMDNPDFLNDVLTGWRSAVTSGPDGSFQIGVLPGRSHLLIQGPTLDYIHRELFENLGSGVISEKPAGTRLYPDGWVKLDLKPGAEPEEVKVTLRRGVTVQGRLIGPDGQPVAKALMLCRLHVTTGFGHQWQHNPVEVFGGRFQLQGCDPTGTYPVFFLDPDHQWGAAVEISGKQAGGEPVTVQLAPCGAAKVRLLNSQGQPLQGFPPRPTLIWLQLVVTPGISLVERRVGKETPFADELSLAFVDRKRYWDLRSDADGHCTFPALIPGATYRIILQGGNRIPPQKDFTVESGKLLDLGEMTR